MKYTLPAAEHGEVDPEEIIRAATKEMGDLLERQAPATGEDFALLYTAFLGIQTSDVPQEFMGRFEVLDSMSDIGGLIIRSENTGNGAHIHADGIVTKGMSQEELITDQGLETMLEESLLAKSLPGVEDSGLRFSSNNALSKLIGDKAAELTGLKVINPAAEKLEVTHPDLAKRLEQVWTRMQQDNPDLAQKVSAEMHKESDGTHVAEAEVSGPSI